MIAIPTYDTKPDNLDEDIDAVLSSDLLKMSFHDRNEINEEIHGVRSLAVDETPELIESALRAFRIELGIFPSEKKQAYMYILRKRQEQHQKRTMFAAYADADEFRLRFLRCLLFDVPRAVHRFANYLNFIQEYWGTLYLARPIQLCDLNSANLKILKKAWTQILPFRDQMGRKIIAMLGNGTDMEDIESIKAGFYLFDVATRDCIQTQREGLVAVVDGACWKKDQGIEGLLNLIKKRALRPHGLVEQAHEALPYRAAAVHFCWPDSPLRWGISNLYMFSSGGMLFRGNRCGSESALELNRFRIHEGDEIEMRYKVKAYGIPVELLPLTGTNSIKTSYHRQWIKVRKLVEHNLNRYHENQNNGFKTEYEVDLEQTGSDGKKNFVTIVECPCVNDVVFRNGSQPMDNPGNNMFRDLILSYWAEKNEGKNEQTGDDDNDTNNKDDAFDRRFRKGLVRDIEVNKKGRFLEWDKNLGVWVVMKDRVLIHRKVSMAFYNCTKRVYKPRNRRRLRNDEESGRATLSTAENYNFIDPGHRPGDGRCCYGYGSINSRSSSNINSNLSKGSIGLGMDNTSQYGGDGRNKRPCMMWPFASSPILSLDLAAPANSGNNPFLDTPGLSKESHSIEDFRQLW